MPINYPGRKTGYLTCSGQKFGTSPAGRFSPPVPVVHSTLANESIHRKIMAESAEIRNGISNNYVRFPALGTGLVLESGRSEKLRIIFRIPDVFHAISICGFTGEGCKNPFAVAHDN